MAKSEPMDPGPRAPHNATPTWQAEQRAVADRNAEAQRSAKVERDATERKRAARRRAAADATIPDGRWR